MEPVFVAVVAVTLLAGFVKGAVGFALPMIMISGFGSLLPADVALAALILPTLFSNIYQAARDGATAAAASALRFWRYIAMAILFILLSAQTVAIMPQSLMFLILGSVVTAFCVLQLVGWRPRLTEAGRPRFEIGVGAAAGALGGISGVWGPPTVMYLTAIETEKRESMRVQGVVYALGSIALTLAHLRSGILNAETARLSLGLVVPAAVGMLLGIWLHDRLDQSRFRQATLVVLVVAGLNLIRRGLQW